jgi:hypothetical protein
VIYTPDEIQRLNAEFVRVKKLTTDARPISVRLNKKWVETQQRRNAEWKEYQRRYDKVHVEAQAKSAAEFAEYDRKRAERYAKRAMCNTPRNIERSRRSRIDWSELIDNPVTVQRQIQWERRMTALAMRKAGLTYKAIGERMGITRSRARQVVWKASRTWINQESPAEAFMNAELHKEVLDLAATKTPEPFRYQISSDWVKAAGHGG